MERKFTDIFPLRGPEAYLCRVYFYQLGHSVMYVRVENLHTKKLFFVVFTGVYYFSGLLAWQGADFQIEKQEKMASFMQKLNPAKQWEDVLLQQYKSYLVPNVTPETRIIAFNAYVLDQLPPEIIAK